MSPDPAADPAAAPGAPAPSAPAAGSPAARRRAARALGDAALARALGGGDVAAWGEFDARFRPLLEAYARRVRVPAAWWPQCVDEVLEDEAMRLAEGAPPPEQLGAYLVRASYHRLLKARRAAARRDRRYGDGACHGEGVAAAERVVLSVCSAAARRASGGPRPGDGAPARWDADEDAAGDAADCPAADPASPHGAGDEASGALARAAGVLAARLTEPERQLLVWVAEQVPRRQIAEWVGDGYEATRKRIQRLTRRLQLEAARLAAELPPAERREFERFLRRAGAAPAARAAPPAPGRATPRGVPSGGTCP